MNKSLAPLFFYTLLAFAISAFLLRFSYFMTPDGVEYAREGVNIVAGKGISINPGEPFVNRPPFYPFLIGLLNLFFKNLELASHLSSVLAFALTVIPLFLLTRKIYSETAAHWATILYLTNEFLLYYSNLGLTEPLFALLVLTEIYLIHRFITSPSPAVSNGILIGVTGGVLYLTRSEGFLFFAVGALSLLLLASKPFASKFLTVFFSLLIFLVFSLSYVCYIYQNTHRLQVGGLAALNIIQRQLDLSHPGQYMEVKKTYYEGLSSDKKKLKMEEMAENFNLVDYLKWNHFELIQSGLRYIKVRISELSDYLFDGLGFLLIGASFFCIPWNQNRKKSECLLFLFLLPATAYLFFVSDPRHAYPFLPIFFIWMGNGIETVRIWTKESFQLSHRKSLFVGLSLCLMFASLSVTRIYRNSLHNELPLHHKELGLWMKKNIPHIEEERVASQLPFVSFYSGAKIFKLPYVEKLEDLITYMVHHEAKYFVISDDMDKPVIDSYHFLLDETKSPPPGLSRKYVLNGKHKMILYQLT